MELEITPEPTPEERAAIESALALAAAAVAESAWWREGVLEAVDGDSESTYVVAEPRNSLGAARA